MNKAELINTLLKIDEEASLFLSDSSYKPKIVIVGGPPFC